MNLIREGEYRDGNVAEAFRHIDGRTDQRTGTGDTGGPACRRTSGASRGGLQALVGNDQYHGRTYGESQRIYGRVPGNYYPFRYIEYT